MKCPMDNWHGHIAIHKRHLKELFDILCIHKNDLPDDCKDCILSEMTYRRFVSDYEPIEIESLCHAIRYRGWIGKLKLQSNEE